MAWKRLAIARSAKEAFELKAQYEAEGRKIIMRTGFGRRQAGKGGLIGIYEVA